MAYAGFGLVFPLTVVQASVSLLAVLSGEQKTCMLHNKTVLNMKIDHCLAVTVNQESLLAMRNLLIVIM